MFKNNQKWIFCILTLFFILFATSCMATEQSSKGEVESRELIENSASGVSASDISMSVSEISVDEAEGKTEIVACIDLPDNSDWIPYTSILDGSEKIYSEQMILIDYKNPETAETSRRCYRFIFPKAVTSKSVIFNIENLQTTIPENLTEEMCKNAQERIRQEYPKFAFVCNLGDHGINFEITEKPNDMGNEEARFLVIQTLTNTVNGSLAIDVEIP